jgi:hypothetical protein
MSSHSVPSCVTSRCHLKGAKLVKPRPGHGGDPHKVVDRRHVAGAVLEPGRGHQNDELFVIPLLAHGLDAPLALTIKVLSGPWVRLGLAAIDLPRPQRVKPFVIAEDGVVRESAT